MVMKIENYTDANGHSSDTFTFPNNPKVFDDQLGKLVDMKDIAYAFSYFGVTNPIKSKRSVVINGNFFGTNKDTNFRSLVKHVNDNKLKKLYFSDDKFMIVMPQNIKRTHSGGRTNFIDYVASFVSPFGILFDDTQKSGSTGSGQTNSGNVTTPIEYIQGSVISGQTVSLRDANDNGFTFTASSSGTLKVYLVTMLDIGSDNYYTTYYYAVIGSTEQTLRAYNNNKSMFLQLAPGEALNGLTKSNLSSETIKFRNGWSSD